MVVFVHMPLCPVVTRLEARTQNRYIGCDPNTRLSRTAVHGICKYRSIPFLDEHESIVVGVHRGQNHSSHCILSSVEED